MATRRYNTPGGSLTVTDPDPLQVALKQAELRNLENQPATDQAKIDAARAETNRQWATLLQQGQIAARQQTEEGRYHTGTLQQAQDALGEETRFHTGQLGESQAERAQREKIAADTLRANTFNDVLMHAGPQLESTTPGITAKLAAASSPEIARAIEAAKTEAEAATARSQVATAKDPAAVSALTATLPPEKANALWNAYKTLHPEKLGPPPAPSQGTTTPTSDVLTAAGATPNATYSPVPLSSIGRAAPTSVTTLDRGVAKPSMGVVNPATGGTTPIPGTSTDYTGGSGETAALALPPRVEQLTQLANIPPQPGRLRGPPLQLPGFQNRAVIEPAATTTQPIQFPPVVTAPASPTVAPATNVAEAAPTSLTGAGSEFGPPQVNVDAALKALVGSPTMEDLARRRRSAQPVGLTPFRTNQY